MENVKSGEMEHEVLQAEFMQSTREAWEQLLKAIVLKFHFEKGTLLFNRLKRF